MDPVTNAVLVDELFSSIKQSIYSHTSLIRKVVKMDITSFRDKLIDCDLLSPAYQFKDEDKIMEMLGTIVAGLELSKDSIEQLEEYCQKILISLLALGEEAIKLSRSLRSDWNALAIKLGLSESFLSKETLPSEELDILKAAEVQPLEKLMVDRQVERFQKQPDPQNKAALTIQQHYQEIVKIIANNPGIAEKLLDELCSHHLTRSAKKRALLQITNKQVQAKSIVAEVSVVITKGVVPKQHFGTFIALLDEQQELQSVFREFIDKYKSDYVDQQNNAIHHQQQSLEHHETAVQNASQQDDDSRAYLRQRYHGLQGAFNQDKDWKFYDLSTPSGSLDLRCIPQKQKFSGSISRRTLIAGGSGVGKSSICIELCKGWSRGELLMQYKYVILVEVRDYPNLAINTVDDLFACVLEENNEESKIKSEITSDINDTTYGANTLFIIDGYDELNRKCREPGSFLEKWLKQKVVPRLHKASLVVTARPHCANEIKKYFPDAIVEVQGLTQESRVQYLKDNLHHNISNDTALLNEPIMERCTLNPFLLAALIEIINEDEEFKKKLPETFTMAYGALMCKSVLSFAEDSELEQFLQDDQEFAPGEFASIPRNIYVPFLNLCALAYHRVNSNSVKKIPYALQNYAIDFRLFNKVVRRTTAGRRATYTFLHPSIQEYLAAYCISRMEEEDKRKCIEVLMQHIGELSDQYSLILEFLHGFGCIKQEYVIDYEQYKAINTFSVIRQLCEVPQNSHEFIKSVYKELKNVQWMKKGIREDQVYCSISRTWPVPSPNDLWCLGKVIALSDCLWSMGLTFRPIQDVHLEMLCKGINSVHELSTGRFQRIMLSLTLITNHGLRHFLSINHKSLSSIQEFWLDSNNLTEESVELLSRALPKLGQLERFLFHHNNIKLGCHMPLMDALKDCKSLKHVSFTDLTAEECEDLLSRHQLKIIELWRISTSSCKALFRRLSCNKTLQDLEIYQTEVTVQCVESLPTTLPASSLKRLKLINCGIEDSCIDPLIEALEQAVKSISFESLDLCDNFITDKSGEKLLELEIDLKETYLYNEFTHEMASKLQENYELYNDKRERCGKHSSLYSRRRRVGLHKI